MPKVSVCVPIYNVEKYIEKCARSLFEQTIDDIEYIFVNDCSPDNSLEILNRVLKEYPHRQQQVKIISHQTNMGLAAARNTCLSAATGEYIGCCDSDDWVELDMFETMYLKAEENGADIVCCNAMFEYETYQTRLIYPYQIETRADLKYIDILHCAVWNKLIRRSLFLEHNITWYEGINMWEDMGLTIRLRYFSRKTIIIPHIYYHYNKQNPTSIATSSNKRKIHEQILCASYIAQFLTAQSKNSGEDYTLLINYIKFESKRSLIWEKACRDIKLWKSTYPETHQYIISYTELSWSIRLTLMLAAWGLTGIACFLIDLNKIRRKRVH